MKSKIIKAALSFFLVLFMMNAVFSTVEVFSKYDTVLKVTENNNVEVNKSLKLKNVYDVGIVPGQIEFKVGRGEDGSIGNIEVTNVSARDQFGNDIKTQLRQTNDYSVIILDIYYPLLPGFEYEFNLFYELSYEPGGIFFKSLQIPIRESTIPIEKGVFKVEIPKNYHFTYLASDGDNASVSANTATWNIENNVPKSVTFEYSWLPIKLGSLKGSYVFWITLNILLLLVLIFEIRKEIRRVKEQYGQEE